MTGRIVLPDEGIADLLSYMLSSTITGVLDWLLILYQDPVDPTYATVMGDLNECTFAGYSRLTLTRSLWQTPTVFEGVATSVWDTSPLGYINTGSAQDVAGYAIIRPGTEVIRFVQELDTPVTLGTGQTLPLWPTITLTTDTCTP